MIDVSRPAPVNAATTRAAALRPAKPDAVAGPPLPAATLEPVKTGAELSPLAAAVKALASAPPVDASRVASLRRAISMGSYRVEPQAIASKMLLLDRGSRG